MFTQVDHIAIATKDIESSLEALRKSNPIILGAREIISRYHLEALMLVAGDVPMELIQPTSSESTVASFIEKKGEGLHHIAYRVANIDAAVELCKKNGLRLIDEEPRTGYADSRVAFLHPKSTLGVLTELVEREPGKDQAPYEYAE